MPRSSQNHNQITIFGEKMSPRVYRQGDLILVECQNFISNSNECKCDDRLEVRSETGNAHIINNVKTYNTGQRTFVLVEKPEVLYHPQHKPITIDPGFYEVKHVRSFDKSSFMTIRLRD